MVYVYQLLIYLILLISYYSESYERKKIRKINPILGD